ncbi:MAG TPA: hypothetical protein PLO33_11410 [Kouleothrix sp.]|uniref:hypothetical protein n=1 Tax=Kouleothrix sp. TaxID=2779161 RepID=UPI002CDF2430|nr:hypothetical protein [Kouleothrix sp.]HRC76274.1 hypothetical protein [Kouleothrix sp.]
MDLPPSDATRCIYPPELDDLALIAAIDGEASPEVESHLLLCEHCAARARHYAELQGILRKQFFRMFCPSTDTLVALHEGTLNPTQYAHARAHTDDCPHCRRELRFLEQLASSALSGRAPPDQWYTFTTTALRNQAHADRPGPALRQVFATCQYTHASAPVLDFYGAARSSAPISQYAFQAENVRITIGVRPVANRDDRHVVTGSFLLDGNTPAATAYLSDAQHHMLAAEVDELGNFVLDNLIPGTYRLTFRLPDREVIIETIGL